MDDGGGFPSINYVPIDHGTNVLDSLMQLYGQYKQAKNQNDENAYLKQNPYQNATNAGGLDAAMKIYGGKEGEARTTELGNEGQAAITNAASRQTEVGNEGSHQQGMLSNDTTRTANEDFHNSQTDADQVARTAIERQNADTNAAWRQDSAVTRQDAVTEANKSREDASADKASTAKGAQLDGLLEHYMTRANSGIPLSPQESAEYDQVKKAAFDQAGIQHPSQTVETPAPVNPNALPLPGQNNSGTQNHSRLNQLIEKVRASVPANGIPGVNALPSNMLTNDARSIYDYATVPANQPLPDHSPSMGGSIAQLVRALSGSQATQNTKRSK